MRGLNKSSLGTDRLKALACALCLAVSVAPQASGATTLGGGTTNSHIGQGAREGAPVLVPVGADASLLTAGAEATVEYRGEAAIANALSLGEARAVAATAGDVNADGIADVVVGYAIADAGAVAVFYGDSRAIYPVPGDAAEVDPSSFLPVADVFATARHADFVATGDFDADGRLDVAVAAAGASTIELLVGKATGGFSERVELDARGAVTALAAGDVGRRDGASDLVAGVTTANGAALTILRASTGAVTAAPETIAIGAPATAIVVDRFHDDAIFDVAVAAGNDLLVVDGRSLDVARRSAPTAIVAIAPLGRAAGTIRSLAILTADGAVSKLEASTNAADLASWHESPLASALGANATRLATASITGATERDLVVLDGANRRIFVIGGAAIAEKALSEPVAYEVDSTPVAALAVRLDPSASGSLVLVREDRTAPATAFAERGVAIVVTTAADSGAGSLRQAILDANATAGADTIAFNIAGGDLTIDLASALPAVTETVTIDATTQPGFSGTPIVELNGQGIAGAASGLVIQAGASVVRGLVINRFPGAGIVISGPGGTLVEGNNIGTNVAGTADLGNANDGIVIADSPDNTIGGTTAAARNVISGNNTTGILVNGENADGNLIEGNYIGLNAAGTVAIPNGTNGISLNTGADATVIGATGGGANVISGNAQSGILVSSTSAGTIITNNFIGVNAANSGPIPNGAQGIQIDGSLTTVTTNRIAFNADNGIFVGQAGTGNTFSANSIASNGDLGIDLAPVGPTPNDDDDLDTGANMLQNFPVITGAQSAGNQTTITGTLESTPSMQYTIQFFANDACDASGFGEGQSYLGQVTVSTNVEGVATINATLNVAIPTSTSITATATKVMTGDTSEFSACGAVATSADVSITIEANSDQVPTNQTLTYTYTIANAGPLPATNVRLFNSTPSGTTFVSLATTQGTCTFPAVGGIGAIECNIGTIEAGEEVTVTLVVRVTGPAPLVIVNTAFVTTDTLDSNGDNNSVTNTVSVIDPPTITSITRIRVEGKPFRLRITGTNFQPGVQVFIGADPNPWPNVKYKSSEQLVIKKGAALKARFPKNIPVEVTVVNPDGGSDTATFTR